MKTQIQTSAPRVSASLALMAPIAAGVLLAAPSRAQGASCADWLPTFGGIPGVAVEGNPLAATVRTFAAFDDGSGTGPRVFLGGGFDTAGGFPAGSVSSWDGTSWDPLAGGVDGVVEDLLVFDDGSGPALYVAGSFSQAGGLFASNIARWDGTSWSSLGTGLNGVVQALCVYDDGNGGGPALHAAGNFVLAGGAPATRIAKWNGVSWSSLADGLDGHVYALTVLDDGTGPVLCAGGDFLNATGVPASGVARWDGTSWSGFGSGLDVTGGALVTKLQVFDAGSGDELYAAGAFFDPVGDADNIAKWDGAAWVSVGGGLNGSVSGMTVFDDGNGPALHVGGAFNGRLARLDGASWTTLAGAGNVITWVLDTLNVGGGSELYLGGGFTDVGGVSALGVASYDGSTWSSFGGGGLTSGVRDTIEFDDGSGPALYVAQVGSPISRWDGSSWSSLPGGNGADWYNALAVHDDGNGGGPALYAGERFGHVVRWDGTSWTPVGDMDDEVLALCVYDDGSGAGPQLYAGGKFDLADGVAATGVARWDGSSWTPLVGAAGATLGGPPPFTLVQVHALEVFDGGAGPELIVAGYFQQVGGKNFGHIARWNGTNWSKLGNGVAANTVYDLTTWDDGTGLALYAGGAFGAAGNFTVDHVAKWDGASWSKVGSGTDDWVRGLVGVSGVGGAGPELYAVGDFQNAGGVAASGVARWDGTSWSPLGSGLPVLINVGADCVAAVDDGSGAGPSILVGGSFQGSPAGDSYLARWGCPFPLPTTYCTAKLNSDGCTPLVLVSGAAGIAAADPFDIDAFLTKASVNGLLFYGLSGPTVVPFMGGTLCVQPPIRRTTIQSSGGFFPCDGVFTFDFNAWVQGGNDALIGAGAQVNAQYWYRDPGDPVGMGLTDAAEFWVGP